MIVRTREHIIKNWIEYASTMQTRSSGGVGGEMVVVMALDIDWKMPMGSISFRLYGLLDGVSIAIYKIVACELF